MDRDKGWSDQLAEWAVNPPKVKGHHSEDVRVFFCKIYQAVSNLRAENKALQEKNDKLEYELKRCRLAVGKLIGFTPENTEHYVNGYFDAATYIGSGPPSDD
jgi:cell division septum initiation protein DivIVA